MTVDDNAQVEGWPLCHGWMIDMDIARWSPPSPVCVSCVINDDTSHTSCYVSRKSWEFIALIFGYRLKSRIDSNGNSREVEVLRDPDGIEPVMVKRSEVHWYSDAAIIARLKHIPLFQKLQT